MKSTAAQGPQGAPPSGTSAPVGARRQILDAAADLLRHGYDATTTRAIAARVGIKAGSIYHHYESKEAIVSAVVNEGVRVVHEAVTSALDALGPQASPRERLQAAIRTHLHASLEHSAYTSASIRAFSFLPAAVQEGCRVERRRYEEIWRGLVAEAAAAGLLAPAVSQDSVRLLLLGAVNWAGEWYRPERMSIDAIAQDFAASILR